MTFKKAVRHLYIIGIFISAFFAIVMFTTPGARFVVEVAKLVFAGDFSVGHVDGTFYDTLKIKKLYLHRKGKDVVVENAVLSIDWSDLFNGRLHVADLQAHHAKIEFAVRNKTREPIVWRWPFSVFVSRVWIENVVIKRGMIDTKIHVLKSQAEVTRGAISISSLNAKIDDWVINGAGTLHIEHNTNLDAWFEAVWSGDNGEYIAVDGTADGWYDKTHIDLKAEGKWQGLLAADIHWPLGNVPDFQLNADIGRMMWPPSSGDKIEFNNLTLNAESIKSKLSVQSHSDAVIVNRLDFGQSNLQSNGTWGVEDFVSYDGLINWQTQFYDQEVIAEEGRLARDADGWQLSQQVIEPVKVQLKGNVYHRNNARWTMVANVAEQSLTIDDEQVYFDGGHFSLTKSSDSQLDINAQLTVGHDRFLPASSVELLGRLDEANVHIDLLTIDNSDGYVEAAGTVQRETQTVSLQVDVVDYLPRFLDLATPINANILVKDSIDAPQFNAHIDQLQIHSIDAVDIDLSVNKSLDKWIVSRLSASFCGGFLSSSGQFTLSPKLSSSMQGELRNCNLSEYMSEVESIVDVEFSVNADESKLTVNLDRVLGALHGALIVANGKLVKPYAEIGAEMSFNMRSSQTELKLDGNIGETLDVQVALLSGRLSELSSRVEGSAQATARFSGHFNAPHVDLSGTAKNLKWRDIDVNRADVSANFGVSGNAPFTTHISAEQIKFADRVMTEATISAEGRSNSHRINIQSHGDIEYEQAWDGEIIQRADRTIDKWVLKAQKGTFRTPEIELWNLDHGTSVNISTAKTFIDRFCARKEDTQLCGNAELEKLSNWRAKLTGSGIQVSILERILDTPVHAAGQFNINMTAQGVGADYQVQASGELSAGELLFAAENGYEPLLTYEGGEINAILSNSEVSVDLDFATSGGDRIDVSIDAFDSPLNKSFSTAKIAGLVDVSISNLTWWSLVTSSIKPASGILLADIEIGGTIERPTIDGESRILLNDIAVASLNTVWDSAVIDLVGAGSDVNIKGVVTEKKGLVEISGLISHDDSLSARMEVTGKEFLLLNFTDRKLKISPDLSITYDHQGFNVNGTLSVPEGYYHLKTLPSFAITPTADEILLQQEAPADIDSPNQIVSGNVEIKLGEDVVFKGYRLETGLVGSVNIVVQPGKPIQASGELNTSGGEISAFGRVFDIESGTLLFVGPLDNPGLSLQSSRVFPQASDAVVGIRATGSLKNRAISVFSEPEMTEQEAMSLLLFGRLPNETDDNENDDDDIVAKAVLALGLNQSSDVARQVGEQFGIKDLNVSTATTDDGGSEVVVGGYVGSRLYLSYGREVFSNDETVEPESSFNLKLFINDKLSLEAAESGDDTGVDIIYTFERD